MDRSEIGFTEHIGPENVPKNIVYMRDTIFRTARDYDMDSVEVLSGISSAWIQLLVKSGMHPHDVLAMFHQMGNTYSGLYKKMQEEKESDEQDKS